MSKLLDHQIAPDPLCKWLVYAPVLGGKTFAVTEYLRSNPKLKVLMFGSDYNFSKLKHQLRIIDERTGLFLSVDLASEIKSSYGDYDLFVFENLESAGLREYAKIFDAFPSKQIIITTSQNQVVQYILDTGNRFDINISKSVFGNSYINPAHPLFGEFQAFKRT